MFINISRLIAEIRSNIVDIDLNDHNCSNNSRLINSNQKVYPMKRNYMILSVTLFLATPIVALAEEQSAVEPGPAGTVSESEMITPEKPVSEALSQNKGMMYKRCRHDKKGQGGMKHKGGRGCMGQHEGHQEVVQRLDMIEARMAKIEAMLESLMRR